LGNGAFKNCIGLERPIVHDGRLVFWPHSEKEAIIPNGVTKIGGSAFSGCTGLTSVVIPDGVTAIGDSAFSGCTGLTSVVIPGSITEIEDEAFAECTALTHVTMSQNTKCSETAFEGCSNLTRL